MKIKLLLLTLLFAAVLSAVDFVSGSGELVSDSGRETTVYFHNDSDDEHWYGSDSWAVLFDFDEFATGNDDLQFSVSSANIFIPNGDAGASLTVGLYTNNVNQPGDVLENVVLDNPIQEWNEIPFEDTYTDTLFWLVVDYVTNNADTFISASSGDGTHSFFEDDGYYYNMNATGFDSEFLFELNGDFLTEGIDLSLDSLTLRDSSGQFYPEFTITNYSEVNLDANLDITLKTAPDSISAQSISITVPPSTHEFPGTGVVYPSFAISNDPSQYEVSAVLNCDEDVFSYNNDISYAFDRFLTRVEKVFVENAVRNDMNAAELMSAQENVFEDTIENFEIINYFADSNDSPYYRQDAEERFHYYDLGGYPFTMLNGENRINGYFAGYETLLETLAGEETSVVRSQTTYVNAEECAVDGAINDLGIVNFALKISSGRNQVFQEYLDNSSLYVVVAEYDIDEIFGGVMLKMLYHSSGLEFVENEMRDDFSFNLFYDFETIADVSDSLENCKLVYWIQNDDNKRVEYVESFMFSDLGYNPVGTDDNSIHSAVNLKMFPSPFTANKPLNISFEHSRSAEPVSCEIYNIKGQRVKQFTNLNNRTSIVWNGKDDNSANTASGIYFIKFEYKQDGASKTITKKCLKIK
jgi:hypothetical protein